MLFSDFKAKLERSLGNIKLVAVGKQQNFGLKLICDILHSKNFSVKLNKSSEYYSNCRIYLLYQVSQKNVH